MRINLEITANPMLILICSRFLTLADFSSYIAAQDKVADTYNNQA